MKTWFKDTKRFAHQPQEQKRCLTRKEKYMKKYLNNEKSYRLWIDLHDNGLLGNAHSSGMHKQLNIYVKGTVRSSRLRTLKG